MTWPPDDLLALKLVGYVAQSGHGFALPLFGKRDRANTLYVATSTPPGDHRGVISGFEVYEPEGQVWLSDERTESVAAGNPWLDVFLWDDYAYVGAADALWTELEPIKEELLHLAPLSLLDAAMHAEAPERDAVAAIAMAYVATTFDAARASRWRTGTLRRQLETMIRRTVPKLEEATAYGKLSLSSDGQRAIAAIPANLIAMLKAEDAFSPLIENLTHLASALGLGLDVPDRLASPVPAPEAAPAESIEPEAPGFNSFGPALVVAIGQRAREIARLVEKPDWLPTSVFNETWAGEGRGREIEIITDLDVRPDKRLLAGYHVVILLIDDGLIVDGLNTSPDPLLELTLKLGTVRLLAPALPETRPAAALEEQNSAWFVRNWNIDALLDTAQARSPFWWGSTRRSLDRRVADILAGVATTFLSTGMRDGFIKKSKPTGMLTFSLVQEGRRGPVDQGIAMCSESTWCGQKHFDRNAQVYFSSTLTVGTADQTTGGASIENRSLHSDFPSFAEEVLNDLLRVSAGGRLALDEPSSLPDGAVGALRFPDKTFAFQPSGSAVGVLITAETPSMEALRNADKRGWRIARYTDRDTILRFVEQPADLVRRNVPNEVEIFDLKASGMHRRMAVRGVDTRDIVRFTSDELSEWLLKMPPEARDELRKEVRPIRASRNYNANDPKEFAVRRKWLFDDKSVHDPVIVALASAKRVDPKFVMDRRDYKRAADLASCWTPPASPFARYALSDGSLPPKVSSIHPEEIVLQTSFVIDGDQFVPALFRSRLFEVWAGATLSRSTSWMSRYSIGVTFAGFPLPRAVRLVPAGRSYALECMDGDLLEQARGPSRSASLEDAIFQAYGLHPDVDDLSILQRLLDMNQELPQARFTR